MDSLSVRIAHVCHLLAATAAAAAAKSLQSCPTLCDPMDVSPPGSPVPGILQARTLEWVASSFSNAWKWKVKVKSLSRVRLVATPWIAAYQAPLSMGFSRQKYWSGLPAIYLGVSKRASLVAQMVKNPPTMQETWVRSLGWEDPLEEGMATDSRILVWRIPWTEEPGGLQSMGSQRVRHDWVTKHSTAWTVRQSVLFGNALGTVICSTCLWRSQLGSHQKVHTLEVAITNILVILSLSQYKWFFFTN